MAKDDGGPKGGSSVSYPGGKFGFSPIKSPKETESGDGVLKNLSSTLPAGAAKPDKG